MNQDEMRASIKTERERNNPDEIVVDEDRDTITIYGIVYSRELFRTFGLGAIGKLMRIEKRGDGVVTLHEYPPGEQVTA